MKNSRLVLILSTVIILVMLSCSKKGDVGPVGPPGPDSVSTSAWISLTMADTTIASTTYYFEEIAASGITQRILDSGLVLSYLQYIDPTLGTQIFNASEAVNVTYGVGNVEVVSSTDYTGVFDFRYVVVPGTLTIGNSIISGPAKGLTKSELENMNFSDVQKLLKNSSPTQ
jgi:hypothetical protein